MTRNRRTATVGVAIVASVAMVVGITVASLHSSSNREPNSHAATTAKLVDLASVDQVRTTFNGHVGIPRLVVLLSPT